jgi:anti-anti-sigma regulatory factor
MDVKLDTKEKFTVITPNDPLITANMTDELMELLHSYMKKDIPHVILNLGQVRSAEEVFGEKLAALQQQFYEKGCSFVVCALQEEVETMLDKNGQLETMNTTPTESEAWDIVQMEEIERELLGDFDEDGDNE